MDQRIETTWWVLRLALGLTAFLAGLDKFFNILANWETYLSPLASQLLPISAGAFMQVVGVIEMAVAAIVLLGYTRLGGYIAAAWLVAIALNLVTTGQYFDIAARDVVMAASAFSLARLTEYRELKLRSPSDNMLPSNTFKEDQPWPTKSFRKNISTSFKSPVSPTWRL